MWKIIQSLAVVSIAVVLIVVGGLFLPSPVEALQCAVWDCDISPCEPPGCDYVGFQQTCWCRGDTSQPPQTAWCGPGEYACNREGQCCPYTTTPPPTAAPGDGGDGGGGDVCGDGSCTGAESCMNCGGDCGACTVVSADVKANGSDADITVAGPYTISWSSVNAMGCTLNGTVVDTFGSIGYSYTSGTRSYDLECIQAFTIDNDTVAVTVDCGAVVDVKANGSDTDIVTYDPYTVSWNATNVNSCTLNGGAVALSGSQVEPASVAGIYPYTLSCANFCGDNVDNVNVEVNFCGNGACTAFENCSICAADCGECPTAWWQAAGGNLFSSQTSGNAIVSKIADPTTCVEPICIPGLSILDRAGTVNSDGFPVTGGGAIDSNGQMVTYRDPDVFSVGTTNTRLRENYSYFYSKFSLGLSPSDDYSASSGDALEPVAAKEAYFRSGNMTIQSPWDVTSGESYVVFVDGDLNIEDPFANGSLINVDEGGFLAFIVSGDITIADTVGNGVVSSDASNIEGVFIADGNLIVASNGTDDKRFVGEGSFVGWTNVVMSRTYDVLGLNNDLYPTETFVYRPDFMKNLPEKMKRAQMLWQETN